MTDMKSKWIDGVLASVLYLVIVVFLIVLTIFGKKTGPHFLITEGVVMLVAGTFMFNRSYRRDLPDVQQAWSAILAGFLSWTSLEAFALVGQITIETEKGVSLFFVALLAFIVAHRHGLQTGPRFFGATFLANWIGHLVLYTQRALYLQGYQVFEITYRASGVVAFFIMIGVYYWMFTRSKNRIQRLWVSLSVFVLVIIMVYAVRGFW